MDNYLYIAHYSHGFSLCLLLSSGFRWHSHSRFYNFKFTSDISKNRFLSITKLKPSPPPNQTKSQNKKLTLFLQVTCTRYLVSGHSDSSTFDDCVNRLPINPPPDTSHVTRQSLGEFCDSHAMFADTSEFSRTIDVTPRDHVANIDLLMLVDTVQSSQHWNGENKKLKIIYVKMLTFNGSVVI